MPTGIIAGWLLVEGMVVFGHSTCPRKSLHDEAIRLKVTKHRLAST